MAEKSRLIALFRPAAIAIHDDRNMPGHMRRRITVGILISTRHNHLSQVFFAA
jgi:hypothetical protein